MNPYELLRIPQNASLDEIRQRYNQLLLIHHPDKGGDVATFKEISKAYKILSNPQTRKQHDESIARSFLEIRKDYVDSKTGRRDDLGYAPATASMELPELKPIQVKPEPAHAIKVKSYHELLDDDQFEITKIDYLIAENKQQFNKNIFNQVFTQMHNASKALEHIGDAHPVEHNTSFDEAKFGEAYDRIDLDKLDLSRINKDLDVTYVTQNDHKVLEKKFIEKMDNYRAYLSSDLPELEKEPVSFPTIETRSLNQKDLKDALDQRLQMEIRTRDLHDLLPDKK